MHTTAKDGPWFFHIMPMHRALTFAWAARGRMDRSPR